MMNKEELEQLLSENPMMCSSMPTFKKLIESHLEALERIEEQELIYWSNR